MSSSSKIEDKKQVSSKSSKRKKQTCAKDTRNYEDMLMDCIKDMFNKGE